MDLPVRGWIIHKVIALTPDVSVLSVGMTESTVVPFTPPSENFTLPWWYTTPVNTVPYVWTVPAAWHSSRLYPFGEIAGDQDIMKPTSSSNITWEVYYKCHEIQLNGQIGAPFFNKRYYNIYVSMGSTCVQLFCSWILQVQYISQN